MMFAVIQITLAQIVGVVLFILIAAAVLGLLWFLIGYIQSQFGGPEIIYKVCRVVMMVMVVVMLICLLLNLAGEPLIKIT